MAIVGGNLIVYLTTDTRQFERGISKATSFLDGLKSSARIAAGILMRDLARSLTQGAVTALKMGARIETLRDSFDSLSAAAGAYVPSLEELRRATQGMVSDTDLLLRANEALALGIPTEDLDDLFDSAIRLGKAMGLDATMGIQALTIGVGRQSRLVLDNLGIIVKAEEAYTEYARRIGKTTATLTENERRLGFQTIALEKITEKAAVLGDNISETEKKMDRWTATIKNATTSLGELLQPLGALAPVLQTLGPTIGVMAATILPTLSAATLGYIGVAIAAVVAVTALIGAYQKHRREMDEVIQAQDRLEDAQKSVAITSQGLINAEEELTAALESQGAASDAVAKATERRIEASERLADAETDLLEAEKDLSIAQQDLANYVSFLQGEVDEYISVTRDMTFSSEDAQQAMEDLSASSEEAQQVFANLSTELGVLQGAYGSTLQIMSELNDEMGGNTDAIKRNRFEIDKVRDAIKDRADEYAGEIKALQDEKEFLDALVESGRKLNASGENRLRQIPREIQALREKSRATDEEAEKIRNLESKIRDLRLENTELSFSLDDAKDAAEDQAKAISDQEEAIVTQGQALSELQDSIDTLVEKDDAAEKAQEDVTEKTDAVAKALETEQEAVEAVDEALDGLAAAHDTVAEAQEEMRESNRELERSLRDIEQATNDLALAEAERERQRLAREAMREEAFIPEAQEGDLYPYGAVDPYGLATAPVAGGDTYETATTQTSSVSINVNVGAIGSSEEARGFAQEFADEAVRELRKRGVVP